MLSPVGALRGCPSAVLAQICGDPAHVVHQPPRTQRAMAIMPLAFLVTPRGVVTYDSGPPGARSGTFPVRSFGRD